MSNLFRIINKKELTDIGLKNVELYNNAYKTNHTHFSMILNNLGINDLYLTLNKDKFNTIYPYDIKWYNIVNI